MTAIACRWLDDGTVARLETAKRADARARQSIAREVLAGLPVVGHPASYFLWLPLPEEVRADRVAADLAAQRVSVATAEPFAVAHVPQALRVALGSTELDVLRGALETVRRVVDHHTNL
jgi:DNA-binding transcriptional MocR family regulator